jgi:hypothetical protein
MIAQNQRRFSILGTYAEPVAEPDIFRSVAVCDQRALSQARGKNVFSLLRPAHGLETDMAPGAEPGAQETETRRAFE